jgi:oligoribonuclease NrnB/cAMP/cGMP phosphodiesterase (DHH superfamily)
MDFVLYHSKCADGFGAAYAAWTVLGDAAQYIAVRHGDPLPELPDAARVAIVDFSYPRDVLTALRERCQSLLVLDHHKSARQDLEGLDFARFDLDKSGARLAWEHYRPDQPLPRLLAYVEDADLWRWQLPHSREVSTALQVYPFEFPIWRDLDVDHLAAEGQAIIRYRDHLIERCVSRAYTSEIGGHRVPTVNSCLLQSEIGDVLCHRHPEALFAGVYYVNQKGVQAWSLRSRGDFDVSAVAESYGGGGHRNAAGFARSPQEFILPVS